MGFKEAREQTVDTFNSLATDASVIGGKVMHAATEAKAKISDALPMTHRQTWAERHSKLIRGSKIIGATALIGGGAAYISRRYDALKNLPFGTSDAEQKASMYDASGLGDGQIATATAYPDGATTSITPGRDEADRIAAEDPRVGSVAGTTSYERPGGVS